MSKNQALLEWVRQTAALCLPKRVHWCDGSEAENRRLCDALVEDGTFQRLVCRPHSFLCRSDPADTARTEDRTFLCPESPEDAGPTNHWRDPGQMRRLLTGLYRGCMRGRVMYVIPFQLGPRGSPFSRIGVQATDSAYVAVNMRIMTRIGRPALDALGPDGEFVRCRHSVGAPLRGAEDVPWPCDPENKQIAHFPEERAIWSYGSGYGGNALLGKKCFALRIASGMGRREGWLAEHMLILGLTAPTGRKIYLAAAFPSACGKTNLAMLQPSLPGWRVECVGDDIAWMRRGSDGRLYAVNPETGFFGVAPGTSPRSNPNVMRAIEHHAVFTNCAVTPEGDVWWEGMTETPPPRALGWTNEPWTPGCGRPAAHPNARFTVPAAQCPVMDPAWQDPGGVPISAILLGGRRRSAVPLVCEARDWAHAVFSGSIQSSETTAAQSGAVGRLRRDPMAMLPFCGYHMGDYFAHWLRLGADRPERMPRVFLVNWFRESRGGRGLWPGFGENARVLQWIFERVAGEGRAVSTPIGNVPAPGAFNGSGLGLPAEDLAELFRVDPGEWKREAGEIEAFYRMFGNRLPGPLRDELDALRVRLDGAGGG